MRRHASIAGVGMYLPQREVTNEELARLLDYDVPTYLQDKRIGRRFIAEPHESTSDMAVQAAREALRAAHLSPEDLDLIILATDTPDYVTPPTSAIIQHKLGATRAGTFDINAACADETIALISASHFIAFDPAINHVLVVGAYGMTKWIDWSPYAQSATRVLATLFSDGAGAVILSVSDRPGFLAGKIKTEGAFWDTYGIYIGTARPLDLQLVQQKKHYLRFHENGHRVPPDFNAVRWPQILAQTAQSAGCNPQDIDLLLTNQVEYPAVVATLQALGLPETRTHWVADKFGYAGSASAFMALYDAEREGKLKSGDLLAFCTSGAGFVMATALFRWI